MRFSSRSHKKHHRHEIAASAHIIAPARIQMRAWRRYSRESMHPICACASGRSPKRLHRRTWWDAEEFDVTSRSQVPAAVTAGSCCGHDDSAERVVYSIDGQVELEQLSHAQRVLCCMDWLSPW